VGLPLASAPTGSGHLGFVGSPVARQSLDYVLWRLPPIYVTLREGGPTAIHGKRIELVSQFRRSFQKEGDHTPNIHDLFIFILSAEYSN
jgi:hypothetical protein